MQLLPRSTRCPLISAPGDKLVLLPSAQYPPEPRQRLILIGAILPRRQHCEAPLAFLFAADKADDAVDIEGIAPLVQRPDDYIAITGFHGRSPHVPVRPPTGCALANFAPNRVFSNLAGSRPPQCKACRQGGTVPAARCSDRAYAPVCSVWKPQTDHDPPITLGLRGYPCPTRS